MEALTIFVTALYPSAHDLRIFLVSSFFYDLRDFNLHRMKKRLFGFLDMKSSPDDFILTSACM